MPAQQAITPLLVPRALLPRAVALSSSGMEFAVLLGGPRLLTSVAAFGLATVVFGLSSSVWLSMAALALTGAADNISVVTRLTLTQLETPDDMRGRVVAINAIFIGASNQLGEFESGATASMWGPVGLGPWWWPCHGDGSFPNWPDGITCRTLQPRLTAWICSMLAPHAWTAWPPTASSVLKARLRQVCHLCADVATGRSALLQQTEQGHSRLQVPACQKRRSSWRQRPRRLLAELCRWARGSRPW
jgi:hypothetical protein